MFCENCGKELPETSDVCINCGVKVKKNQSVTNAQSDQTDSSSVGFAILSAFFPIVGLVLYLVWKDQKPKKAKSCGIGALVGGILYFLGFLI